MEYKYINIMTAPLLQSGLVSSRVALTNLPPLPLPDPDLLPSLRAFLSVPHLFSRDLYLNFTALRIYILSRVCTWIPSKLQSRPYIMGLDRHPQCDIKESPPYVLFGGLGLSL